MVMMTAVIDFDFYGTNIAFFKNLPVTNNQLPPK